MPTRPYDDRPIVDRPPLEWSEGKRLAFYVTLNVEREEAYFRTPR